MSLLLQIALKLVLILLEIQKSGSLFFRASETLPQRFACAEFAPP